MSDSPRDTASTVDLRAVVDDHGLNAYRIGILLLVVLAMFVDGYDAAAISFASPTLSQEWRLAPGAMGSVFGMGGVGVMLGGGAAALLGDWLGRRRTIILGALLCALTTFGTSLATDLPSLTLWRFVSGLGIGALSPICLVIANEFAPSRIRATVLACMFLGFTAGGQGAAGWIAARLVPAYGWEALFYFGGVVSLLACGLLAFGLPESLKHLYVKQPASPHIPRIAARLNPSLAIGPDTVFVWRDEQRSTEKVPLRLLFAEGRWRMTPILWIAYFSAQMAAPALSMWLPTLLHDQGVTAGHVAYVTVAFSTLGLVGAMISARLMDRFGLVCHAGLLLIGAPLVLAAASIQNDPLLLSVVVSASGLAINGGLIGMSVLVGFLYPTAIRSTGVGLAIFISRFGMILGPVVVGLLLARHASIQAVFQACALPLMVAAVGVFFLGLMDRPRFEREKTAQQAAREGAVP